MAVWNTVFEATPGTTDDASYGDDKIRELKTAIRERVEKEHVMDTSSGLAADDGWHRMGSALVYVAATYPAYRPGGTVALNANDKGRLWLSTADGLLRYYDGSAVPSDAAWVMVNAGPILLSAPASPVNGQMWVV